MADPLPPLVLSLQRITPAERTLVGGKGYALARLAAEGFAVPETLCLTTSAYHRFVRATGLLGKLVLELGRKHTEDMRWEEMWDTALRIRSLFDRTAFPEELEAALGEAIESFTGSPPAATGPVTGRPLAIRSSAIAEDSAAQSFAGLHESFLNIRGTSAILAHVRKVWASLWSDAALLYRQELGLDVENSAMAVVLQELVAGDVSGVAFGQSPVEPSEAVIEAVTGLNQALVDGTVEPDRWILRRRDGVVVSHRPGERGTRLVASFQGVELRRDGNNGPEHSEPPATSDSRPEGAPLLSPEQVQAVHDLVLRAEELFGCPQDVEWTFHGGALITLQSRPITTPHGNGSADGSASEAPRPVPASRARTGAADPGGAGDRAPGGDDRRSWYLSLRRSFENLQSLRTRIEGELIPEMISEGQALVGQDLGALSDDQLADEIQRRQARRAHWEKVYWDEFIPFAHGVRLFGRVYNDRLQPPDPFEFVDVLRPATLESLERNQLLSRVVALLRRDPQLRRQVATTPLERIRHEAFQEHLAAFLEKAGNLPLLEGSGDSTRTSLAGLLLEMAASHQRLRRRRPAARQQRMVQAFLNSFPPQERGHARELLELGRSSYRLRDDDNLYLGRIEQELWRALNEGRRRLGGSSAGRERLASCLQTVHYPQERPQRLPALILGQQDRQLVGQPAGEGLATGVARVVLEARDLFAFKKGEILICDALDPNMTFVIPLAAAVVERRGGMLIHGAIIAREYGVPCVTGIPELTSRVPDGARVTVDGYLGIVVVHTEEPG